MKKNGLSKVEIFFFIAQTQIGIGILSLPNTIQNSAGSDGWISVLLAGVLLQLILFLYWLLLKRFPTLSYPQITTKLVGKYVGTLLNVVFYIYFILTASLVLLILVKLLKEWLLYVTPYWVIILLILLTCFYLAASRLHIVARFFVLISILLFGLIGLSLLSFTLPMDLGNIFPLGETGLKNILIGTHESIFLSFYGFEAVLFLYPYAIHKEGKFLKTISLSNMFVTGITTYFVFICILIFNEELLSQVQYPVVYFLRALQFQILDRVDLVFISLWIVPMMMSVVTYLFLASKCLPLNENNHTRIISFNSVLLFLLTVFAGKDDASIEMYSTIVQYISYGVLFCVPLILLILSYLRKETSEEA